MVRLVLPQLPWCGPSTAGDPGDRRDRALGPSSPDPDVPEVCLGPANQDVSILYLTVS